MTRYRTQIITTLSVILGIILIYIWLMLIDTEKVVGIISDFNKLFLFPAIVLYLSSYFIRSLRLKKLLSYQADIPVFRNYAYVLAGNFLNYLIPLRAGELAKSFFYKKNHNIGYSSSLPAIFIDKIFDTFVILVVLVMVPFMAIVFDRYIKLLILLLICVFVIGLIILYLSSKSAGFIKKTLQVFFFFIPHKYKARFDNFIHLFVEGIAIFKHHKNLFTPSLILTFTATLTDSLYFFLMFSAFGIEISFFKVMFGYTLIFLSYVLPHPPAQIGSNELIMVLIFSLGFGYGKNEVSAVMLMSHFVTAVVIFITGWLSLTYTGLKLIDIFKNKENNNEQR